MVGQIIVLIGPSGVGKTTLAERAQSDGLADRITTCTTRAPRPHETPNKDYYFMSLHEFSQRESLGEFVENEWIHGNRYGVLVHELSEALGAGKTAIISLGYGGASRVKEIWPQNVHVVGILPPSTDSLKSRLRGRGAKEDDMAIRLRSIDGEAKSVRQLADTIVVNDQFEEAYQQLRHVLNPSGCTRHAADS